MSDSLRRPMRKRQRGIWIPLLFLPALCLCQVHTGADVLVEKRLDLLAGKRIGLITNLTGRLSNGVPLVDTLRALGIPVTALFGPEHGIRGTGEAGETVSDSLEAKTGIPVHSLYGATRKPTAAMLRDIDVLVYDIQDVGARFYSYISTMVLCMEAAAEAGLPFIVLDRPDPLGGLLVDGPLMEDSLESFVGMLPIPAVYGLTSGELARMVNGEGWMAGGRRVDLIVVGMEGWRRWMSWRDTGLPWIPPSPNIPSPEAALAYPATCFVEATNISEGRGTDHPFELVGAPFLDPDSLAGALTALEAPGVRWTRASFTPQASKFRNEVCRGVRLEVTAAGHYRPLETGIRLLRAMREQCPSRFQLRTSSLARLAGSTSVGKAVEGWVSIKSVVDAWASGIARFKQRSRCYRLYH